MGDGDDLVPDVLGLSTETATVYSATGGRIRAGTFTNAGANGAPTATNGWIVTGVSTAQTLSVTGNATISGNLGVAGTITYEDVARVDATGISTFREGFGVGPLAGIALTAYKDGSIRTSGIITASTFGSDTNSIFTTGGSERLRITSGGLLGVNVTPAYSGLFGGSQKGMHIGGTTAPFLRITSSTGSQGDLILQAGNSGGDVQMGNLNAGGDIVFWNKPSGGSLTETLRIRDDGDVTITGASDLRLTIGNQGTAGTNDSNWIRGEGANFLSNAASGYHRWEIGGAEKMHLDSNGDMWLRSSSSGSRYIVLNNSGDSGHTISNNLNWVRGNGTNVQYNTCGGFHAWEISGSEKFRINSNGSASLTGSLSQNTSDDRLKKDKVEILNALDKVNSLSLSLIHI